MTNHPTAELRKFSGYSVVPGNGNILVANWLGDGNVGTGPHAVEFDADNNLVWSWKNFSAAQTVTNLLVVAANAAEGDADTDQQRPRHNPEGLGQEGSGARGGAEPGRHQQQSQLHQEPEHDRQPGNAQQRRP